jgi:hypothetical protein
MAVLRLSLLVVLVHASGGADDEALRHLLSGNQLAGQGKHLEAIEAWRFPFLQRVDAFAHMRTVLAGTALTGTARQGDLLSTNALH